MKYFRRKVTPTIEAEQFREYDNVPPDVWFNGKVEPFITGYVVEIGDNVFDVYEGDYITYQNGYPTGISRQQYFETEYEEVNAG